MYACSWYNLSVELPWYDLPDWVGVEDQLLTVTETNNLHFTGILCWRIVPFRSWNVSSNVSFCNSTSKFQVTLKPCDCLSHAQLFENVLHAVLKYTVQISSYGGLCFWLYTVRDFKVFFLLWQSSFGVNRKVTLESASSWALLVLK